MRKLLIATFLVLLIMVGTATGETILCKPNDNVNARRSPSTSAVIEGRFECGDEIETDGKVQTDNRGRKWVHVIGCKFEVSDVWVCASYVQDSDVTVETCNAYVSAKGRTALRKVPNGKRIKWLDNGKELTVLAYSDEWALTTIGYVSMECLDFYGGEMK